MKLLVVNQYFYPDQASTAQLLTELCTDLAETWDVTVVCGRPSYSPTVSRETSAADLALVRRERLGSVKILRMWSTSLPRHTLTGRLTNYATYLTSSLVGVIRAEKPDVILTMTDPPFVAAAAMLAGTAKRVPFVYVCQDVFPDVALTLGKLGEGRTAGALRSLNNLLRSRAAAVVSIGRDMSARLLELGTDQRKVTMIPNWADAQAIRPLDGPSALRSEQGWNDRFVVMHSGNVGLSQDLDVLIHAAANIRRDPDVQIAIVGDGGMKERLQQIVRHSELENVAFLPYQPKGALSDSLGAADLHVVSLHRGLAGAIVPSKVYGIMAAGRPFVAAVEEDSEVARIVEEFGCGVRCEPGDPFALSDAIRAARSMDLEEMGRRGRKALEERFDRRIAASAYDELLRHAMRT